MAAAQLISIQCPARQAQGLSGTEACVALARCLQTRSIRLLPIDGSRSAARSRFDRYSDLRAQLHQFRNGPNPHFGHDPGAMHFYGLFARAELGGNLFVEPPANDLHQDLALTWREVLEALLDRAANGAFQALLGIASKRILDRRAHV